MAIGSPRRTRIFLVLTALAILVAAGAWLYLSRNDSAGPPVPPEEVPSPTEIDLALRYAPVYRLRLQDGACDNRGEAFVPSPVELVLGQPAVRLRQPDGATVSAPTASDLAAAPEGSYLDYPGDPTRPGCRYERDARGFGEALVPTVYARIAREPDMPGLALQYWSYYYFNDWNNKHEADWEFVQLVFDAESIDEAITDGPDYAVYAQHGSGERAAWDAKKLRKSGEHPIVYVSAGSHASYFSPNTYIGLGEAGAGLGCDVAVPPHRDLVPEVVLFQEGTGESSPGDAWLEFRGRWGQVVNGEFSGPTGPQTKRGWRRPLTWAEEARSGSATLPGGDVLGINAVHAFCDAVETGSLLLRAYLRFPALVAGSAFLVGSSISLVSLVVLRDAVRAPRSDPAPVGFLRRQRTLGQLIRASFVIYGRFPRLFLGLAFLVVPATIVFSVAQGWLLTIPPFDRLHWVFRGNDVSKVLVGMLAGGIGSFFVYVFVGSGAVAAVRAIDEGESPSLKSALGETGRRAPHIGLGRLRTLLVIALFGFSIIGLPVAAWLAVRWFFVEEAVVLDGESHWRAPGASSSVVDGQWLRALSRVLCFGVLATFAGPLLAVSALVGTDADPAVINLVAGLFHMATLPFTAIGLALSYGDLKERAAAAANSPVAKSNAQGQGRFRRLAAIARRWTTALLHFIEGRRRGK